MMQMIECAQQVDTWSHDEDFLHPDQQPSASGNVSLCAYEIKFSCEKDKKLKGNSVLLSRFTKMNAVVAFEDCMCMWTLTTRSNWDFCPSLSVFLFISGF